MTQSRGCVLLSHLTCDVLPDGTQQMAILVYDVILPTPTSTLIERYAWLQENSDDIRKIKFGNTVCCVQWVGNASTIKMTIELELTHEKNTIVVLGSQSDVHTTYEKFIF
jgi:hypothetical protein